jgi:hypothetical protein
VRTDTTLPRPSPRALQSLHLLLAAVAALCLSACANAVPPEPVSTTVPIVLPAPTSERLAVTIGDYSGSFEVGHNSIHEAIDGDLNTGWTSVHKAVGEQFELLLDGPYLVTELRFYFLPPQGSRIRELRLVFADGSTQEVTLLDESGWQSVPVTSPATDRLCLIVRSVTDPVRFATVYIPEVEVYGYAAP